MSLEPHSVDLAWIGPAKQRPRGSEKLASDRLSTATVLTNPENLAKIGPMDAGRQKSLHF